MAVSTKAAISDRAMSRRWLAWILIAHVLLGVIYSVTIPMWEAYDEWGHYAYVRFVADNFRLPEGDDGTRVANDERKQPPLYYFLVGALVSWIDAPSDFFPARNFIVSEDTSAGYNYAVHPDSENFPYRGTALAMHFARWMTVLLSTVGVWATYQVISVWLPDQEQVALLGAAIHAFWPQYLFHGSVITNDLIASVAGSLLSAALFVWMFRSPTWRAGIAVLAALILVALSKFAAYGLIPFGAILLTTRAARTIHRAAYGRGRSPWLSARGLATVLPIGLGVLFLLGGVGFSRGAMLGGRLVSYLTKYLNPSLYLGLDWLRAFSYLPFGGRTFWALFGWANLEAPGWTYPTIGVLGLASGIGLILRLRRSPWERMGAVLLTIGIGASVLAPLIQALHLNWNYGFIGRFFLSAITPVSALLAAGYSHLWPERLRTQAMIGLGLGLAALAASLPFTVILPAYARPDLLPPQAEAQITHPLDTRYGGAIRLAGYEVVTPAVRPGDTVEVSLYWQSIRPVEDNYILAVKLVDSNFAVLQEKYLFPGRGNFATSLWKPGDFFEETYALQLPASLDTPFRGQFLVGFLDENWQPALAPTDAGGQPVGSWFGEFKVSDPSAAFQPGTVTSYRLGDRAALAGYTLHPVESSELKLDLYWESLALLTADYTVSVALLGPEGEILAQADSQPRGGAYPTHLWEAGEKVQDSQALLLPAGIRCGAKTLYLGLYDPAAQFRLPVADGNGVEIPDRAIRIPVTLDRSCVP